MSLEKLQRPKGGISMMNPFSCASAILLLAASVAYTGEEVGEATSLPRLDGSSAKGLEFSVTLGGDPNVKNNLKAKYAVGERIQMWCTVKNTTDSIKPIGWHTRAGPHFLLVNSDNPTGGVFPDVFPQIYSPIMIKSKGSPAGYVLFLPPRKSLTILLSYKPPGPMKFRGKIRYDPAVARGGWDISGQDWNHQCVYSNEFEYEVVAAANE